jgi:tetratricopeptide (TPR) repeat protein
VKKILIAALVFVCLLSTTAWSQDDIEFYNRGLKSSLAYKKIEYFSKAIQANPNMAEAFEKRAIHFYFQRRFDKAIQDYTKVIELKPHSVDAYLMLGRAYLRKKKGSGIKGEIKNLVSNLRKHQIGEYNQSLERAIENFSRAIELDPQLASAYSYRADAYRIKGMTDAAICNTTIAIWLHGDRRSLARAYATRAKIYRKLGQNDLSELNFRKSVELDPYLSDFPPLHVPLMHPGFGNTSSPEPVGRLGLIGIIILAVVVIFKLTLPAPKKRD